MCAIDALLYMPWMLIALRQIKTVSSDYWIAPIDRNSLSRYFWYAFRTNENTVGMICGFILVIFSILGFISAIKNFKERNNILALINMLLMPLTVVTGVIASFLLRPIFVERYMLPAIACFWFGFSYLISKLKKGNGIYVVVSLVLLGIGISEYPLVLEDIKGNRAEMEEIEDLFLEMNENDIIVHTSLNTEVPVAMYCPNSEHFLIEESSTLAIDQLVFEHVEGVLKTNEIDGLLKSGKTLWCFVYPSIENINEEWKSEISKATYVGTYSIDWCDFYVYKWN